MRAAANPLLIFSLVAGLFGAVTAYLPPLTLADGELVGLTLNAPAGTRLDAAGKPGPVALKDARLTPALLAELRAAGVRRVRVKEFAFARWSGSWLFLAGCAGLAVGARLAKARTRPPRAGAQAPAPEAGRSPAATLAAIRRAVDDLHAELPTFRDRAARCHRALDVLGGVQDNLVPDFIAQRPALVDQFGLGGYARLMDRFAAGERQVNRAWSAAADGIEDEITVCLERAGRLLGEAVDCLKSERPAG